MFSNQMLLTWLVSILTIWLMTRASVGVSQQEKDENYKKLHFVIFTAPMPVNIIS